jgi:hypothetical protein
VLADVVKCPHLAVVAADHQHRGAEHGQILDEVVAGVLDRIGPADVQPVALEHHLALALEIVRRDVRLDRHRPVAEVRVVLRKPKRGQFFLAHGGSSCVGRVGTLFVAVITRD